ncbi:MAG: hypothetical protein ACLSWI_05940 [Candidatus Gastranaerophilaceae bacterium]
MGIYWFIWVIILIVLEAPLIKRLVVYNREFEFSKQIAVIILMLITALIVYGLANLGLTIAKFMVK